MAELDARLFFIEVAHARPERQRIVSLRVPGGTTAREAAERAGLEAEFPDLDPAHAPLGIFGKTVADDHALRPGDRVELYRPLQADPRDMRRAAAAAGQSIGQRRQTGSTGTSR